MPNPRKKIESIREKLLKQLEADSSLFERSIIRQIDYLYRQTSGTDTEARLNDLVDAVSKQLKIPSMRREFMKSKLVEAQKQIKELWFDYFAGDLDASIKPGDFEKMSSVYQVDFPKINKIQQE